jgi:hypothetical protein
MAYYTDDLITQLQTQYTQAMQQNKTNAYKSFILHLFLSLPSYTLEQRQHILSFLLEHTFSGYYRITKYDESYREYYNIMIAVYGVTCPHVNADSSIDISVSILLDMLNRMSTGCTCNRTSTLHLKMMHY